MPVFVVTHEKRDPWVRPGGTTFHFVNNGIESRDLIEGVETRGDGRCVLKTRVRAAATEGEANDALTRLIARTAGVAPSAVRLIGGATSRIKRLHIGGDPGALAAALARVTLPRLTGAAP
jgi:uncharacterized protein